MFLLIDCFIFFYFLINILLKMLMLDVNNFFLMFKENVYIDYKSNNKNYFCILYC